MNPKDVFIIAECGVNHNGSVERALELIDCAAEIGASAVKFQTFRPEQLVSRRARKADYQRANVGGEDSQLAMLTELALDEAAHHAIVRRCVARQIEFMSTPFDEASCDLLERVGVGRLKIGSGDLTHLPFLRYVAGKRLPVILSTGMSNLSEVESAVTAMRAAGNDQITLLHCVTEYPAPAGEINLLAMDTMRRAFAVPIGYSDHTLGNEASVAAVALGATVIEKHLTLDKTLPGPDHKASADPEEFRQLIGMLRNVRAALGDGIKRPAPCEMRNRDIARRSLVATRFLAAGTRLLPEHIAIKRPASGIQPCDLDKALGLAITVDIDEDTPISWDMLK
jgi:N,N'-diacetyllegionaminate synthase